MNNALLQRLLVAFILGNVGKGHAVTFERGNLERLGRGVRLVVNDSHPDKVEMHVEDDPDFAAEAAARPAPPPPSYLAPRRVGR